MENRLEEIRKRVLIRVLDNGEIQAMFWTACDDRRWLLGEIERMRAALKIFANEQNWWITDPRTAEWAGDDEEPWRIARRALAGEEE